MNTTTRLTVMALALWWGGVRHGLAASGPPLLSDGLVLNAIDGQVLAQPGSLPWVFVVGADVPIGENTVPADSRLPLLPCHAMTALVADMEKRTTDEYRLWVRVTCYQGRNYLYPTYFIPLESQSGLGSSEPSVDLGDPNEGDPIGIPAEVLARMKQERSTLVDRAETGIVIGKDVMLLGRRGFFEEKDGDTHLVLEGVGLNAPQKRLRLLPSRTRDIMEKKQAMQAERLTFRVSGVETRYQGQPYVLLHQAVGLYGHGNFNR